MSRNGWVALLFHTLFVVFMLAPIVVVCLVAFTPEGFLSLPTRGFSLRWFRAIALYPEFISAFWTSVKIGLLSSTLAVLFAVPAALALARSDFSGRETVTALLMSPLMIPHVVLGIAFLRFFTEIGLGGRFAGLVLAHLVIVLPFALRLTLASASRRTSGFEALRCSIPDSSSRSPNRLSMYSWTRPASGPGRSPACILDSASRANSAPCG